MTGENLISVEMTEEDAKLFLKFREHQDDFLTLVNSGVFKVRNGVAILNFSPSGELTQIDFNFIRYKKGLTIVSFS